MLLDRNHHDITRIGTVAVCLFNHRVGNDKIYLLNDNLEGKRVRQLVFSVGEDWVFLAILGIIVAIISFCMDYLILVLNQVSTHKEVGTGEGRDKREGWLGTGMREGWLVRLRGMRDGRERL